MISQYHRTITTQALETKVSSTALKAMIAGNLAQDHLNGLIGHPEFHFDDNAFEAGMVYIARQYELLFTSLNQGSKIPAWLAFGRITHAAQDFYAHSNYVNLWIRSHPGDPPEKIEPLDADIIHHPDLRSGRIYAPWETMAFIPGLGKLLRYLLPRDSHAWMNLDSPRSGNRFEFAQVAAVKRTGIEFQHLKDQLDLQGNNELISRFCDFAI